MVALPRSTHSFLKARSHEKCFVKDHYATPLCQYFLLGWLPLALVGFRKIHWYEIIFPNINIAVEKIHFRKGKIFLVLLRFRQINTMPMIVTGAIKSNFYHTEQKRCLLTLSVLSTLFRLMPHLIIDYLSYLWVFFFFLLISLSKYSSGQVSLLCFSYRSLKFLSFFPN